MATRRSPILPLVIVLLTAAIGAALWMVLGADPEPEGGSGRPLVELPDTVSDPGFVAPPPVESRPAVTPAEPPAPRLGSLSGAVVDENRVPRPGARVSLHRGGGGPFLGGGALPQIAASLSTDESGRFAFASIEESDQVVVAVRGDAFSAIHSGPHLVAAGKNTDVGSLVAPPGLNVLGSVLDLSGRPVPGASVSLGFGTVPGWGQKEPAPIATGSCDENGRFSIPHAPRTPFVLVASAPGFARAAVHQGVPVDAAQRSLEFTLQLAPARPLTGRVLADADQRPLPGVEVILVGGGLHARVLSDSDGKFRFDDMAVGVYHLNADPPGFLPIKQQVQPEAFDGEVVLNLLASRAIEGRVLDPEGRAVGAYDLQTRDSTPQGLVGERVGAVQRVRDPQGRFRVEDLEPGVYVLELWAKNHAVTLSEPVRVKPRKDTTGVSITLQISSSLGGQVLDDLGQGVAGARLSLHVNLTPQVAFLREGQMRGSWHGATLTDAEGRFEFSDVTASIYQVEVDHRDYPATVVNHVQVSAGKHTQMEPITLPRPAVLTGQVIDASGQLMTNTKVFLGGGESNRHSLETMTNGQGRYRFERLEPGPYMIRVYSPKANPFENIAVELQRIQRDEDGNVIMRPDVILQPGEVRELLVRADG